MAAQPSGPAPFADLEKMCHSPLAPGVWQKPGPNVDQEELGAKAAGYNPAFSTSSGARNTQPGRTAAPMASVHRPAKDLTEAADIHAGVRKGTEEG